MKFGFGWTLATATLLIGAGCGQSIDIPIPLESPPQEISATEGVQEFESQMCSDADSEECAILKTIDYSDDEQVSTPPALPAEFPTTVTLVDPDTGTAIPDPDTGEPQEIDVLQWLEDNEAAEGIDVKQAIPVDLREQAAQAGLTDPSQIENIGIGGFALNWIENGLTFSTVDLDLYASTVELPEDVDPDEAIANGDVTLIGRIPAQPPETTGEAAIAFVSGGNATLNEGLRNLAFTLVVALPPDSRLELADGAAPDTKKKPTGEALVSVKATLVYTVKTPDALF